MEALDGIVGIRPVNAPSLTSAIKVFRAATALSFSEIKNAVQTRRWVTVARLFDNSHDESERSLIQLLDGLEDAEVEYEILLDGEVESREHLENALTQWRDIQLRTERMADLESGEPCIETLEWLKRDAPTDVFRQTLQQIADGDGYDVEAETLEWVSAELAQQV